MRTDLRVVSPYRAQQPESGAHQRLGPFDWVQALQMLRASVARACQCETVALTDLTTDVGTGPSLRYATHEPRLMLWILDVSVRYLESVDFDRDTILISPDTLVGRDLRPYFGGDLSLLVRTPLKYRRKPLLNAVQWWPVASKARLCAFYAEALARARTLPANLLRWGADSEAIAQLIAPVGRGFQPRAGLCVRMLEASTVMLPSYLHVASLRAPAPIVDFKGLQKQEMAAYFRRASWAS